MFTRWTSHISDPEEKLRFQNQIQSAKPVIQRLMDILKEDEQQLDKVEMSTKQFDNQNWAYRQAFNNGGRSAYDFIKKLIDLDQQKEVELNDRKFTRPIRLPPNTAGGSQ